MVDDDVSKYLMVQRITWLGIMSSFLPSSFSLYNTVVQMVVELMDSRTYDYFQYQHAVQLDIVPSVCI